MLSKTYLALVAVLVVGCASVAVDAASLEERTAAATGMAVGSFTISNRVDEGMKTSYVARGKRGQVFSCYVTGGVSLIGRSVSDAMCTAGEKSAKAKSSSDDNALTRAYKKSLQ